MSRSGRSRLLLTVSPTEIRVEGWHGSDSVWTAEHPYGATEDLIDIVALIAAGVPEAVKTRSLEIIVVPPLLQVRELPGLPPVRARDLRAMIQQQVSQFFRQNGSPLVADAHWLPGTRGQPRLAIAAATDEALVEIVVEAATGAGFSVSTVRPGPDPRVAHMSLLPRSIRALDAARGNQASRRAAAAVAALWAMVGLLVAGRAIGESRFIDAELARLEQPLAAVRSARLQIHGARVLLQDVATARATAAVLPRQLVAIVRALPDSVVLSSITLEAGGSGAITGLTRHPHALAAALEADARLVKPHLEGVSLQSGPGADEWGPFTLLFTSQAFP